MKILPTGYTPCELCLLAKKAALCAYASLARCARGAIFARLACASTDSLALDYVASGSNRSGRSTTASLMLHHPKNKRHPKVPFIFGAGYGNRTRLRGLGSHYNSRYTNPASGSIVAQQNGKFKPFLSKDSVGEGSVVSASRTNLLFALVGNNDFA